MNKNKFYDRFGAVRRMTHVFGYFVFKFGQCWMQACASWTRSVEISAQKAIKWNRNFKKMQRLRDWQTTIALIRDWHSRRGDLLRCNARSAMRSRVATFAFISTWKVFSSWTLFLMGDSSALELLFLSLLRNRFICARDIHLAVVARRTLKSF